MSRQSVWPSAPPPSDHLNYLEDCIAATEVCVHALTETLQRLEPGVRDLPRLTRVLSNEHRFLVLPQTTIQTHLTSLSSSLAPQIDKLLSRAEQLVEAETSKLESLESRLKIMQSATLPSTPAEERSTEAEGEGGDVWTSKLDGVEMKGLSVVQAKKIRILKNKRERLEKERIKLGLVE